MEHEDQPELRLAGDSFSEELVDEGFAGALDVAQTLAEKYHLPLIDLGDAGVDAEAVKMIALPVLNRVVAIPFASDNGTLKVAITNPQDVRGLDELQLATRLSVEFYVAARSDVLTELRRLSRAAEAMNATFAEEMAGVEEEEDAVDDLEADDGISEAPLVRLVNSMIFEAAEDGASDIHVEPQEDDLVVRYRIDGVLHVAHHISKRLASGVTTRLKVLAKLDIAERRRPQDGRISLNAAAAGRMLDIRVATLPDGRRRGGHHAPPRQVARGADARVARPLRPDERADGRDPRAADGGAPRHRADRIGQVDDALRGAERDQPARDQHHHRRGSRRVSARPASTRCRSTRARG